ncbi:MAG: response regulator transcription factor [Elusimicrobia bacterium]|nr:response regulator transcription factor [Elusimicrobiota bacterium]
MSGSKGGGTVLVIDDDRAIVDVVETALKAEGYSVRTAKNADQAFATMTNDVVDMLILDVQLPGISGLKLLEIVKQDPRTSSVPVLMLTTRKSESDKVAGLKTGADDYLGKPFSVKELLARVEALLRRTRHDGRTSRVIEAGGIRIDLDGLMVTLKDKKIDLRKAEFDLLVRLMQRSGQVLTYQILSEALSDGTKVMTSENLYWHAKNLRQKLGSAGAKIETVHGIGYRFNGD